MYIIFSDFRDHFEMVLVISSPPQHQSSIKQKEKDLHDIFFFQYLFLGRAVGNFYSHCEIHPGAALRCSAAEQGQCQGLSRVPRWNPGSSRPEHHHGDAHSRSGGLAEPKLHLFPRKGHPRWWSWSGQIREISAYRCPESIFWAIWWPIKSSFLTWDPNVT